MKRERNKAVTSLPVLVPCASHEQDGVATFEREFAVPQPVRVVTTTDFLSGSRGFHEAFKAMWDYEKEQFRAVSQLITTLQSKDKLAIRKARDSVKKAFELLHDSDKKMGTIPAREDDVEFGRTLISVFGLAPGQEKQAIARWNDYCLGPRAEADHKWLLSQLVSSALDSAKLVLWWSGKRFQPALYCSDPKAAVYAFLLLKLALGCGWGICPYCGEIFIQKRSDQSYCTIAHREAHRVARWRTRKTSKTKQKDKQDGTRKTR